MSCPCGVGENLSQCCGPFLKGTQWPQTAEALMRSRYTAYVLQDMPYLQASWHPKTRRQVDFEGVARWAAQVQWLGLSVLSTTHGGVDDHRGIVEFEARYLEAGVLKVHHEISDFKKKNGRWYFLDRLN